MTSISEKDHLGQRLEKARIPKNGFDVQLETYLRFLYSRLTFLPEAAEIYPTTDNIQAKVEIDGYKRGLEIIHRNNEVADILNGDEYRTILRRQRHQKGPCAIGICACIDGRLPIIHLVGQTAGVTETMAGEQKTRHSSLDGRLELASTTLGLSIASKPTKENAQLLEGVIAHDDCGAMKKKQAELIKKGTPLPFDDLILSNFDIFSDSLAAMTRKYNNAATSMDRETLNKVGIRFAYFPERMALVAGYGDDSGNTLSSFEIATQLSTRYPDYDSKYQTNFEKLEVLLDKERDLTDLVDKLFADVDFNQRIAESLNVINELASLTPEQSQAYRYIMARISALNILTGTYKTKETDHKFHVNHPFAHHNESYMALTVEDGLNPTVGQFDPEVQVFGAAVSNIGEAIDHIKTESILMDKRDDALHPRILFISAGVAEDSKEEGIKQARATLARSFNSIVGNRDILKLIKTGKIVPIPVIIKNRSAQIIEIPNLAL